MSDRAMAAAGKLEAPPVDPQRSALMAKIGSRDTQPELLVRRAAHRLGLRFRLHDPLLPGRPDLKFPGRGAVVFVHGCFWHRHPGCKATRTPKSRIAFWESKFKENEARDQKVQAELSRLGWRVIVIWECESRNPERLMDALQAIMSLPKVSPPARLPRR